MSEAHNAIRVSVVVPIYGVEKFLDDCISSICMQSYRNLEIILVDDGSPDNCPQICDEWAKRDERIKVIHKKNGGLGPARNDGLKVASGEYIAFVDSDDVIASDMYETMVECMETQECDIVTSGRVNVMEDGSERAVFTLDHPVAMDRKEALRRVLAYDAMDSSACDKLFRRELFDGIEFPQGYISEDVAVMYKIVERAEKGIYHCGKAFYYYFQRNGSLSKSKFSEKTKGAERYHREVYEYVCKQYPELTKEAEYFYLSVLPLMMDIVSVSTGGKQYGKELLHKMKEHLRNALRNPYMSGREKIKYVLVAAGIYTPVRRFYVKIKGY